MIIEKVIIERNTNGDSRVAKNCPTFYSFQDANDAHIKDVQNITKNMAKYITYRGEEHDWSKVLDPYMSLFYRELCNTIEGKMDFMDGEWAKLHYEEFERHHLLRHVPDDVNLFDVLEMIADCVAAGLARSGEVRPLEIDNEILTKAMNNTVKLVESWCEIKE